MTYRFLLVNKSSVIIFISTDCFLVTEQHTVHKINAFWCTSSAVCYPVALLFFFHGVPVGHFAFGLKGGFCQSLQSVSYDYKSAQAWGMSNCILSTILKTILVQCKCLEAGFLIESLKHVTLLELLPNMCLCSLAA